MKVLRLVDSTEEEIAAGIPVFLNFGKLERFRDKVETYSGCKLEELENVTGEHIYAACNGIGADEVGLLPVEVVAEWLTDNLGF